MKLKHLQSTTGKFLSDNSPTILTGLGLFGLVGTAYLTGHASFKAYEIIDREESITGTAGDFSNRLRERAGLTWKLYIPAAVTLSLSAAAIIGANRIGTRRAAAVTAAYAIAERGYEEYKSKVVETIGENKEKKLRDQIMQDRIDRHPLGEQDIIDTGGGKDLCYDAWNGRYFWGSQEAIKQAQNAINYKVNHQFYASLTDFYDRLGLDRTMTSDEMGWCSTDQLEIAFTTTFSNKGQPVCVMNFVVHPIREYQRVH